MKYTLSVVVLSFFVLLVVSDLNAEVHIEITRGIDSARPISVIPLHLGNDSDDFSEEIVKVVETDLRNSGKFNPLNHRNLQLRNVSTIQETQSKIWSTLGVYTVILIRSECDLDDNCDISYRLVDTGGEPGSILMQNSYRVNKQWLRHVSHTISDQIFEKLTGIRGAFRTRIAYVSQSNVDRSLYELCISDYDGYNKFVVYRSSQPIMSPAWSPDGSKLVYVAFENGHSTLVIQTLSNGYVRKITCFPHHNGAPALSPDGTKLAFALSKTGSLHLYVMDCTNSQIRQITNGRSNNTEPTWFPDNQYLAFTSDQTGYPQIYKVNINDSCVIQRITWEGSKNQNADVSSDGKFMVMVNSINGQQHIAKQDLTSGKVQIMSSTLLDETPSLAPNDTMVVYSSSQEEGSVLNLASMDGRFKTCLPITKTHGRIKFPSWSPYLQTG